jgi:hypothetical protein
MPILNKPLIVDKGKAHLLHAVLFPKTKYSIGDAVQWLNSHNLRFIHNRETIHFYRFRIREQILNYKFYTVKLKNGVELVYMYK